MDKKEKDIYLKQMKFIILNYYIPKWVVPLTKEQMYKIPNYWDLLYSFVSKNMWKKEYIKYLLDIVVNYLEWKWTKWAKLLLDEYKKDPNKIEKIWEKILNKEITDEENDEIFSLIDHLINRLTKRMLNKHSEWLDKVTKSFYKISFLLFPI